MSVHPSMLTVREAATILRVNVKTLYGAIDAGDIKAIRVGRIIRIPRVTIEKLIENGGLQGS